MEEEIARLIEFEMEQSKLLFACLSSLINREEVQKLKTDDPATFCELLAFYEEAERRYNEIRKIATRLGMSD